MLLYYYTINVTWYYNTPYIVQQIERGSKMEKITKG